MPKLKTDIVFRFYCVEELTNKNEIYHTQNVLNDKKKKALLLKYLRDQLADFSNCSVSLISGGIEVIDND